MLKTLHQLLQPLKFLLLALVGLGLQLPALALFFPVGRVITGVTGQLPVLQLIDHIRRPVQKKAVMGHHDHGSGIAPHILFQPPHRLQVQVVGRLVKQQNVRFIKQQADQCDFGPLPAGKTGQPLHPVLLAKTKAGEQRLVLPLVLKPFPGKWILLRAAGQNLLLHGPVVPGKRLLAQHADGRLPGPDNPRSLAAVVAVQVDFPSDQAQERGLTGSVFAHHRNFFRTADLKIDMR